MKKDLKKPSVTAVIPVFAKEDVLDTVPRLLSYHPEVAFRIVVVDNGNGRDLSFRLAALAGNRVRVVRLEENRGGSGGFIAGVNAAMANDAPDYVWLLDDDAIPNEDSLSGLLEGLLKLRASGVGRIACLGSAMLNRDEPSVISECGADISLWRWNVRFYLAGVRLADAVREPFPVDYCAGCSVLVPTEVVRRVGFWEDVFIHYDDVEWCLRAKRKFGLQSYATASSAVVHPPGASKRGRDWIVYFDVRNWLWLCSRFSVFALCCQWLSLSARELYSNLLGRRFEGMYLRRMAMRDFLVGKRRTRREIVDALERRRADISLGRRR